MKEELIQEFRNGNKRAGDDFYNANIQIIYYAVKKFKPKNMDFEETLAISNQAFAKAMMKFDSTKGEFITYFMVLARSHILMHCRDLASAIRPNRKDFEKKITTIFYDSLDQVIFASDTTDICLKDTLGTDDDQSLAFVNEALTKINKEDRQVFNLYHFSGYTQSEIAEMFNSSQVSISRSLARAKAKLQIILKDVG